MIRVQYRLRTPDRGAHNDYAMMAALRLLHSQFASGYFQVLTVWAKSGIEGK